MEAVNDSAILALLLSDQYRVPVMVVERGHLVSANEAASAFFGPVARAGAAVSSLFDDRSRRKLAAALARDERATVELQALGSAGELIAIRFLVQPLGATRLLVASGVGSSHADRMVRPLLETNAQLANLTRALSLQVAEISAAQAQDDESEHRFRALADNIPEIVWTCDPDGSCDYGNQRFLEYTGMTLAELRGSGWLDALHPDDRAPTRERWKRSLETGEAYDAELRLRRSSDGAYQWHLARAQPLRDRTHTIRKWFGVSTEIDERKRFEEFQQQLVGSVGHDLRSPLSVILGRADLLLQANDLPAARRESIARIHANAGRMSAIIRDLTDFTRMRVGAGISLQRDRADLWALCREMIEDLLAQHPGRAITFSAEGDGAGLWDGDRLERVVENLVTNALKYGDPGSRVRVTCRGGAAGVEISVHNEGRPIPEEVLPHIFEPFRRGVPTDAQGANSLGLGLHIAQAIVAAHGGTIAVSSTQEAGTTFAVRLPRDPLFEPGD